MNKSTKKLTKEEFIQKAKRVHGDLYDYSKVEYKNSATKVKIICKKHGEFEQRPNGHLMGNICLKCSNALNALNKKLTKEEFIQKAKQVHGDLYDYSKVEYNGSKNKICIIHPKHGEFWQTPNAHLSGQGFPLNKKLTKEEFIQKAKRVHGDLYDYSKVEYKNSTTIIKIICKKHGEFEQIPKIHLKSGCPICKMSHGERKIYRYLIEHNIDFKREKKFNDCFFKYKLPFDFYIPKYNLCIEFDGRHHFEEIRGDFSLIKKRDEIKNNYCKNNNIKLIRIPYWKKLEIDSILKEALNV